MEHIQQELKDSEILKNIDCGQGIMGIKQKENLINVNGLEMAHLLSLK